MPVPEQALLKKKERKGFDLLEAIYAEQGLISGDSSHLIGAKAIGDARAQAERKVGNDKKRHRAEFIEGVRGKERGKRFGFLRAAGKKKEKKQEKLPPQMKKPDLDDPKGKKEK